MMELHNMFDIEEALLNELAALRKLHGSEYTIETSDLIYRAMATFPSLQAPSETNKRTEEDTPYWPHRFFTSLWDLYDKHWVEGIKKPDSSLWWRIMRLGLVRIAKFSYEATCT
jgi:hypothetical protein